MLQPKQMGKLAELVFTAITRYPEKPIDPNSDDFHEKFKDGPAVEKWESWLTDQVSRDCTLPPYKSIVDEVEMLVHYYADRLDEVFAPGGR